MFIDHVQLYNEMTYHIRIQYSHEGTNKKIGFSGVGVLSISC